MQRNSSEQTSAILAHFDRLSKSPGWGKVSTICDNLRRLAEGQTLKKDSELEELHRLLAQISLDSFRNDSLPKWNLTLSISNIPLLDYCKKISNVDHIILLLRHIQSLIKNSNPSNYYNDHTKNSFFQSVDNLLISLRDFYLIPTCQDQGRSQLRSSLAALNQLKGFSDIDKVINELRKV